MINTLKVKIEGLNSAKILNAMVDSGVYLKNLKEKPKCIIFEIEESKEKILNSLCKQFHRKYQIISKNNLVNLFKKTKYYLGSILATILVAVFLFSFNLYVFDINLTVASSEEFDTTNIEKLLLKNNIKPGMKKNNLNIQTLEKIIIASDERISGCSVQKNGSMLDIMIYPAVLKDEVSIDNVYSKFNAIVTHVEIFSGKSEIKVGDFVKEGDLLIENDNGASGKIMGIIYYSDYLLHNENQTIKEFTGDFEEEISFMLFEKTLFKSNKNIKFSNYLEEKCVFYASKFNFLPLKIVKTKYLEFNYKDVVVKFLDVENELKQKIYLQTLSKINSEHKDKITNVTYSVVTEDNLTRLDCFVECEINLAS